MLESYLDPWHEGVVSLWFLDFGLKKNEIKKAGLKFYCSEGQTLNVKIKLRNCAATGRKLTGRNSVDLLVLLVLFG